MIEKCLFKSLAHFKITLWCCFEEIMYSRYYPFILGIFLLFHRLLSMSFDGCPFKLAFFVCTCIGQVLLEEHKIVHMCKKLQDWLTVASH